MRIATIWSAVLSLPVRIAAIDLLAVKGVADAEDPILDMLDDAFDPRVRIALARTLWVLTRDLRAKTELGELEASGEIADPDDFIGSSARFRLQTGSLALLAGAYGVGFFVMFLADPRPAGDRRWSRGPGSNAARR